MIRKSKIRSCLTFAIIFLFTALLSGCSGCSKSGLIRERYKAAPADSIDNTQSPTEEPGDSSFAEMKNDDGIKPVWTEINGIRLQSIFDKAASSLYVSSSDASDLLRQGVLHPEPGIQNFQGPDGKVLMGTRVNLESVRIDDSLVKDVDAIVIDDKLTDLLLTKSAVEDSAEVQSGIEADGENMIPAGNIYGRVVSIVDGDTYDILIKGNKTLRIRMEGIDAPEKGMPFYQVAKNYLGKLCFSKNVKVRVTDKDSYGRYVGFTFLDDGTELSHEMIKAGYAWHYKQYNSDPDLSGLEVRARDMKSGLWADKNQLPPWTVRTLHNKGISTKNLFNTDIQNQ